MRLVGTFLFALLCAFAIQNITGYDDGTTTQAPETTTEAPATTTAVPDTTTQAPETTTEAPETTTQIPQPCCAPTSGWQRPGSCPLIQPDLYCEVCKDECTSDIECAENQKCCCFAYHCGNRCQADTSDGPDYTKNPLNF